MLKLLDRTTPELLTVVAVGTIEWVADLASTAAILTGTAVATERTLLAIAVVRQDTVVVFIATSSFIGAVGASRAIRNAKCDTSAIFEMALSFVGAIFAVLTVVLCTRNTDRSAVAKIGRLAGCAATEALTRASFAVLEATSLVAALVNAEPTLFAIFTAFAFFGIIGDTDFVASLCGFFATPRALAGLRLLFAS